MVSVSKLLLSIEFLFKGDIEMMAMLFAQKVILGTITFSSVPNKLKEKVREILIESGLPELAEEN